MKKYPSINQFRNIVRTVRDNHDYQGKDDQGNPVLRHTSPYPTLMFKGTVKLHGTNAAVVLYKDGTMQYQSRERVLNILADNAGFMTYMLGLDLSKLFENIPFKEYVAIYGEWCGGNIQKGVAITGLPKMFVIFDIVVDDVFMTSGEISHICQIEDRIYNIHQAPSVFISIDFNNPELSQNQLIEATLAVEEECPVGKLLGVSGIGEGLVFSAVDRPDLKFKSKGEKHSSSKVKILNSVNEEEIKSYLEFVDYACTENRLKQGLEHVPSRSNEHTGAFLKWVANDILKEESDTLVSNNIEWKRVAGMVAKKASEWFRGGV